jgi:hypothetical protein
VQFKQKLKGETRRVMVAKRKQCECSNGRKSFLSINVCSQIDSMQ